MTLEFQNKIIVNVKISTKCKSKNSSDQRIIACLNTGRDVSIPE